MDDMRGARMRGGTDPGPEIIGMMIATLGLHCMRPSGILWDDGVNTLGENLRARNPDALNSSTEFRAMSSTVGARLNFWESILT